MPKGMGIAGRFKCAAQVVTFVNGHGETAALWESWNPNAPRFRVSIFLFSVSETVLSPA
jgi:hypothetical protein